MITNNGVGVSLMPPSKVNVVIPTGMPGPKGDPGIGVAVLGTYAGANTPLPADPVVGDMWIIGTPIPTLAPPRPDSTPAQPGDGMVWDGSAWVNTGVVQGPQGEIGPVGPPGPIGPSGIVMSPNPPPTKTVLWADTDEAGGSSAGGISGVFAHNSPLDGISSSPGNTLSIRFTDPTYGTATAFPPGWAYDYNSSDARVIVPPGVYSFYFGWNAPDQYWSGQIQGVYQLGTESGYVDINPGAPVLGSDGTTWYGAASGTAALHNTQNYNNSPWFSAFLTHGAEAASSTAVKWAFNVTRLGDIPA